MGGRTDRQRQIQTDRSERERERERERLRNIASVPLMHAKNVVLADHRQVQMHTHTYTYIHTFIFLVQFQGAFKFWVRLRKC